MKHQIIVRYSNRADRSLPLTMHLRKCIAAALKPSVNPRLMDRRICDWRLLAVEYDHDNCLDEDETDRLDQVLDAILIRDARFCPVLLTLVNEREETIRSAGVIADQLRFTDTPVRRWFDRRVLREMVREARASRTQE